MSLDHYKLAEFNLAVWTPNESEHLEDTDYADDWLFNSGLALRRTCDRSVFGDTDTWADLQQAENALDLAHNFGTPAEVHEAQLELDNFRTFGFSRGRYTWQLTIDKRKCDLDKDELAQAVEAVLATFDGEQYRLYTWIDGDEDSTDTSVGHGDMWPDWVHPTEVPEILGQFYCAVPAGEVVTVEYDEDIEDYNALMLHWDVNGYNPLQLELDLGV